MGSGFEPLPYFSFRVMIMDSLKQLKRQEQQVLDSIRMLKNHPGHFDVALGILRRARRRLDGRICALSQVELEFQSPVDLF